MAVWLVRAGKQGQHEQWCLETSTVGSGWREIPDLTGATTREDVQRIAERFFSGSALPNYTGQLWRLRHGIAVGDLVVVPLKTTSQLAIGRVTGPYRYDASQEEVHRHTIPVEWLVTDLPRTAVGQDLLYSLGSAMTVCAINRNDAEWRIGRLVETGRDPGARVQTKSQTAAAAPAAAASGFDGDETVEEAEDLDLEQVAKDRVMALVAERFAGYEMQNLVAAILKALGYVVDVPPKGPDGGVDVVAWSGPLGLDSTRVIVQVKSGDSRVEGPTVQQLQGAITTHGADHGLLVAWGGLTSAAAQAVHSQRFAIRVWGASDLIAMIYRTYEQLPGEIQAQLPLKSVWIPVESGE